MRMRDVVTTGAKIPGHVRRTVRRKTRWPERVVTDPGPSCPISWKPSVFAPVFYGYRDEHAILPLVATRANASGEARAAAGPQALGHPVRVFYPSLDGSPQDAPMLQGCGRYPLVLLAHGECGEDEEHWKKWLELPAVLARCGYVVLVPERSGAPAQGNDEEQRLLADLIGWARARWSERHVLMPPPATALVGHSNGGSLAGAVAANLGNQVSAFVSLSGIALTGAVMQTDLPKLFMWGQAFGLEVLGAQISQFDLMPAPVHVAELHHAGHWDYLPAGRSGCGEGNGRPLRGTCPLTPLLAADVVACFLTRYVRPEGVPSVSLGPFNLFRISSSLRPPTLWRQLLTQDQKFFAGGHLMAWSLVPGREDCGVTLRWKTSGGQGELVHE